MPNVKFTSALQRFFPKLDEISVDASTVDETIRAIDKSYPKLSTYILNEKREMRKHVNIFINNKMISDREGLTDKVNEQDVVYIMQALSGG